MWQYSWFSYIEEGLQYILRLCVVFIRLFSPRPCGRVVLTTKTRFNRVEKRHKPQVPCSESRDSVGKSRQTIYRYVSLKAVWKITRIPSPGIAVERHYMLPWDHRYFLPATVLLFLEIDLFGKRAAILKVGQKWGKWPLVTMRKNWNNFLVLAGTGVIDTLLEA